MTLREALVSLSVSDLRGIARLYHLQLPANVWKDTIIDALVRYLTSRAGLDAVLSTLSFAERAALNDLIAAGGRMMSRLFTRDHGAMRYRTGYRFDGEPLQDEPLSPADSLSSRGLIFRSFGAIDRWTGEIVVLPIDLLALLPPVTRRPFVEMLERVPEPATTVPSGELIRDIGAFLCYLQRETVRPVRVDRLSKRDLVRLNGELTLGYEGIGSIRGESDTPYFEFLHHLAQLLGLVRVEGTVISPTAAAEEWLDRPPDYQLGEAWRRFTKDGNWDDVKKSVERQFVGAYPGPQHLVSSRSGLAEALRLCPAGVWLSVESLSEALRIHVPTFLRTQESANAWASWSASEFYGSWHDVEAAYLFNALVTWLVWFGVVDVDGNIPQGKPRSFRVTQRGAVLLGVSKGPLAWPEPQPFVVQANFEIVVPYETPVKDVFKLQQIATMTKHDRASIYALTPAVIWQSLQAGTKIEDVIAFLERASGRPLPQNVAYSLREWATKHGEITIEPAILLQTATDALMAQIKASKRLPVHIKDTISPRAVTIEGDVPALVDQLKKAGFWPKSAEGLTSARRGEASGHGPITVRPSDLVRLLVGAILVGHIAELEGWESPISDLTIRNLSWNLPPALVKAVDQLAREAIARFDSTMAAPDEK